METKFIKVFDLQYAEGRHYYNATRRSADDLVAVKSTEEFQNMLPDAVSCIVIWNPSKGEPKLLLNREFRYPAGQFLLSVQDGAEGSECFDGFSFLTKEQAQKILKDGVDEYGIFYSVYTWTALTYFVADMWKRNPIYKCTKK